MKAKQWIKDYLDFAMPLIMVIVALNLVDSILIGISYASYNTKFGDFFTISEHLGIFMQQIETGRFFLYSLIFLGSALFLRLFTNKLKVILDYPFCIILIYAIIYELTTARVVFIFIDGIILFIIARYLFMCLKLFFANCYSIIKNIAYIAIFLLAILVLLINKFEILKLSLEMRQNILTAIFCIMIISMLYDILKNIKSNANIIIPQDIKEYQNKIQLDFQDSMLELQDTMDSIKEKRKIKNIIKDLIDYAKK